MHTIITIHHPPLLHHYILLQEYARTALAANYAELVSTTMKLHDGKVKHEMNGTKKQRPLLYNHYAGCYRYVGDISLTANIAL